MRPIAVLALPFLLGACALPAVYSIASLAIDGISYAASGKGVTDHALSAVANEDCAMWRVLIAQPICRQADVPETTVAATPAPEESPEDSKVLAMVLGIAPAAGGPVAPEILVASATEFGEFELTAAAFTALPAVGEFQVAEAMVFAAPEPDVVPDEVPDGSEIMKALAVAPAAGGPMTPETGTTEAPTKAETPATTTAAPAERETAAKPAQLAALVAPLPKLEAKPKLGRFVVLASYLKEAHARAAMERGREFQPRMARVHVRGKLYYRVVSGPYARDAIGAMRRTMIGGGFPDAWAAKLCQDTLRLAPCPAPPLPLNLTAN